MGSCEDKLSGFSWASGVDRNTSGIVMWNDVFLHDCEDTGDKLAIFLMDTQGLFDNNTSANDNSRIFALGTLISSFQIFNLFNQIQEDQLEYLLFATEFAKFSAKDNQNKAIKPFQNLMFLVR